jgi:glycosyltransferase involved in cell wall biosynthesis
LRSQPADIVLAHGGSAAIVVALVPRRRSASVWQRILPFPPTALHGARRLGWQLVARRFDAVVALSRALEDETRAIGYRGEISVIPNFRGQQRFAGVDRARAARALHESLGVPLDVPLVGLVAHLVEQKQPEVALEVIDAIRGRGQPIHLVVAGDGPRRALVERRAAELGLSGAVSMLGHRDDPEHVLAGVEVALITSRSEGIPGVAIEAQMSGCPVVTFPVGSVDEVVEDGVTGAVLARSDPATMADAVVDLLRDDGRRRAMGAAAARRSARFAADAVAARYATLLMAVATRSAHRPDHTD